MTNSDAKQRVLNFFDNEISNYFLKDINNLLKIEQNADGNCSIPLALTLFSIIDLFAYLTNRNKNASKRNTETNYKILLSETNLFPKIYKNEWENIVKLFRHGLVHQFFPKACGIKRSQEKELIIKHNNTLDLNVNVLCEDLKIALNNIKTIIQNNDDILINQINDRLDKLAEEDYKELNLLSRSKCPAKAPALLV